MIITSTANLHIKSIRRLRDRKARQECGCFYAEGLRIVMEAVQLGAHIETLVVAPELLTSSLGKQLVEEQRLRGIELLEVSPDVFSSIALKEDPVGIAAVISQRWTELDDIDTKAHDLWLALDRVADPGNLGTILRTSDAVGARGVILLEQCTDPYDPTAARASMGALFSQCLVKASFAAFAAWKKNRNITLIGTSGAAQCDYQVYAYPPGMVLMMGSEREGLPDGHKALCDQVVSIPMMGRSDSLNLAVATGVVLYEILNQKRRKGNAS
jgi:RNA methyltransferase, TrmH family